MLQNVNAFPTGNMIRIIVALTALVAAALAAPDGGYGGGHGGGYGGPQNYNFDYAVKAGYGGNFGHNEYGDGYNAKGKYYVNLPDGRVQIVTYHTDKWGYHADVAYKGKAQHPSYSGPAVTFFKGHGGGGYH